MASKLLDMTWKDAWCFFLLVRKLGCPYLLSTMYSMPDDFGSNPAWKSLLREKHIMPWKCETRVQIIMSKYPPLKHEGFYHPLHDITLCHHRHIHLKWTSTKRASTFIAISLPFSNIGRHCNCLWCDPPYSTQQPLKARKQPCLPLLGFLNSFIGVVVQPIVSLGTIQRTYIPKHVV